MINRRHFLVLGPMAGLLGLLGGARAPAGGVPERLAPPEHDDWNWWRDLPRTPLAGSDDPVANCLCQAAAARSAVTIIYSGGSQPGSSRRILPLGVFTVDGYSGIYVHAICHLRDAGRTFRVKRIVSLV